ncbi:MAG: UDP-N-acetylglucosamine--N-acetylmuramyl-(pentapeptide) pyrophosphoryl-undecaprenol N-acetylglucosamine transferase [Actinomycetes bacterium]
MRILIAAGGTAGHVIPALSVADELRGSAHEVEFVGGDRAEASLVPAAGFKFHQLQAEGLSRTSKVKALRAAFKALPAVLGAVRLVRQTRPDVILGGGGYVAGIAGAAAVLTRTPLVLTEADSHLGISNRALARFAKRVCLGFPIEGHGPEKFLVTGRPVPVGATDRAAARQRFGISPDAQCVLVTGGSLGASSINKAAVEAFASTDFEVLHLAGERDLPSLTSPRAAYHLEGYVEGFGEAVAACDLAVARAGGSVFELAAQGCPAILIPYPHAAGDHQTGNARWMEAAGAAVVMADGELSAASLGRAVDSLLRDPARLKEMAGASASLARPDAAREVAAVVIEAGQHISTKTEPS